MRTIVIHKEIVTISIFEPDMIKRIDNKIKIYKGNNLYIVTFSNVSTAHEYEKRIINCESEIEPVVIDFYFSDATGIDYITIK